MSLIDGFSHRKEIIAEGFIRHIANQLPGAIDFIQNPPAGSTHGRMIHCDIKPHNVFLQ
jgi:serine/threonine protein kinase